MDIHEIKRDARSNVESLMGMFDFIETTIAHLESKIRTAQARGDLAIGFLCSLRQELRRQKQYELADRIRDNLQSLGVTIEDEKIQPQTF